MSAEGSPVSRELRIDTLRLQLPAALQPRSAAIVHALTQALENAEAAGRLPAPWPGRLDRLALPALSVPLHASDAQIGQALAHRLGLALGAGAGRTAVPPPQPLRGAAR